ncbi:MAG: transporter substrate-binding domain-containing protein [Rhodospirillaceae bacterium]|nr:transporter substrate-binding domain-containing protein [Rhodospirillaceae bacterium]
MQQASVVHDIGILMSTTGSYRLIGEAMLAGALLAVEEINAAADIPFQLNAKVVNPGGVLENYAPAAKTLLTEDKVAHVVGCYTSSSRKEVLPLFEKNDGLLWYPSHYEGFETSENVVYTGASPNHHVIPLSDFMVAQCGGRAWLVGSNYIWAWENNRIMRESLVDAGGRVLGERYLPVGETDVAAIVEQILAAKPDFVFNTLIGDSSYVFFREFRRAAEARGMNQPAEIPVVSCSLSEPELAAIGPEACDGHLSSSVYFESIDTPENQHFVARWHQRHPQLGACSADAEATYIAVHLLAMAIGRCGTTEMAAVREAVGGLEFAAPQGCVQVDPENRHCYLYPRIGRSRSDGGFDIIADAGVATRPDPYLVWRETQDSAQAGSGRPRLKVVS